jgi:hypothetical protein
MRPPGMPPPMGAPAPPPPPMGGPPPGGTGGIGPASAIAAMYADLSPHMGPGWQSIDVAVRAVRIALRSVDFQKTPAVVAVFQSVLNTMTEMLSHYTSGTSGATASSDTAPRTSEGSSLGEGTESADADAQPSASAGSSDEGES